MATAVAADVVFHSPEIVYTLCIHMDFPSLFSYCHDSLCMVSLKAMPVYTFSRSFICDIISISRVFMMTSKNPFVVIVSHMYFLDECALRYEPTSVLV